MLVLAAQEHQPGPATFPGLKRVIYCPIDDDVLTYDEAAAVERAADSVLAELRLGRRVLVTCWAGRNRSGVILARAMVKGGASAAFAVASVQARRPHALTNQSFVQWLLTGRLARAA